MSIDPFLSFNMKMISSTCKTRWVGHPHYHMYHLYHVVADPVPVKIHFVRQIGSQSKFSNIGQFLRMANKQMAKRSRLFHSCEQLFLVTTIVLYESFENFQYELSKVSNMTSQCCRTSRFRNTNVRQRSLLLWWRSEFTGPKAQNNKKIKHGVSNNPYFS